MPRVLRGGILAILLVPSIVFAGEPISRRDGFLTIWESIKRPAIETREAPFPDVPKGSKGFTEITYAKYRGLLSGDAPFRPDAPLQLSEALVMMLRLESVDNLENITADSLPQWLQKYPLGDFVDPTRGAHGTLADRPVDAEELGSLLRKFDTLLKTEDHEVSLYAEKWNGQGTAFGEIFDMNAITAAHRTFPYNTLVKVTNVENGKSVIVRINDRGPYVKGRDMDLSLGAFTAIADRSKGKIRATFERLGDVSLANVEPTAPAKKQGDCPTGKMRERLLLRAKKLGLEAPKCS